MKILKKKKTKTLRANYLIPSLVAINRNNLIKPLISILILNLLPIVFFFFLLLVFISLLFQFFFFSFSCHLYYSYSCKKNFKTLF